MRRYGYGYGRGYGHGYARKATIKGVVNPTDAQIAAAIKYDPEEIQYLANQTQEYCRLAIRQGGRSIPHIKDMTPDLCSYAVNYAHRNFEYIKNPSYELCKIAVRKFNANIKFVKGDNRTKELYMMVLKKNGTYISCVPKEMMDDDMKTHAIQSTPSVIGTIDNPTDELCKMVVLRTGANFKYIPLGMRTKELCVLAVKKYAHNLNLVPDKHKTMHMCEMAVRANGDVIKDVPDIYSTDSIKLSAIRQSPSAINHIKNPTDEMVRLAIKNDGAIMLKLITKLTNSGKYPDELIRLGMRTDLNIHKHIGRSEEFDRYALYVKLQNLNTKTSGYYSYADYNSESNFEIDKLGSNGMSFDASTSISLSDSDDMAYSYEHQLLMAHKGNKITLGWTAAQQLGVDKVIKIYKLGMMKAPTLNCVFPPKIRTMLGSKVIRDLYQIAVKNTPTFIINVPVKYRDSNTYISSIDGNKDSWEIFDVFPGDSYYVSDSDCSDDDDDNVINLTLKEKRSMKKIKRKSRKLSLGFDVSEEDSLSEDEETEDKDGSKNTKKIDSCLDSDGHVIIKSSLASMVIKHILKGISPLKTSSMKRYFRICRQRGISEEELIAINPLLKHFTKKESNDRKQLRKEKRKVNKQLSINDDFAFTDVSLYPQLIKNNLGFLDDIGERKAALILSENPELVDYIIETDQKYFTYVDKPSYDQCIKLVKKNGMALLLLSEYNEELLIEAVKSNWMVLKALKIQSQKACREAFKIDKKSWVYFDIKYKDEYIDQL